jgi:hypothetical protein
LAEGFDLFATDTLRNLLLGGTVYDAVAVSAGSAPLPWYLEGGWSTPIRFLYVTATIVGLFAPFALLHRYTRLGFVAFAIVFHLVNLLALGVTFYENMILLVAFSEIWFHDLAKRIEGRRSRPSQPEMAASST